MVFAYTARREGTRVYLYDGEGRRASPWHDVPCFGGDGGGDPTTVNMVCEVPAGTRIKYEVTVSEPPHNPIQRDRTADGKPRSYPMRMPWNYGMIPRTWEDPSAADPATGLPGDGDPLDVVDVSASAGAGLDRGAQQRRGVGEVYPVRLVGALALVDSGELDWKMIAVASDGGGRPDPACISRVVESVKAWFAAYKPGSGNRFELGGRLMPPGPVLRDALTSYAVGVRERRIDRAGPEGGGGRNGLEGGAVLGEGGQGSVRTMDELRRVLEYEPVLRLRWANMVPSGGEGGRGPFSEWKDVSTGQIAKDYADRAVFKVISAEVDEKNKDAVDREFQWVLGMAKVVAEQSPERASRIARTLARDTCFMVADGGRLIVGAQCYLRRTGATLRLPFYRRMDGSVDHLCNRLHAEARRLKRRLAATLRADIVLSMAVQVLRVIDALASVDVHHMDIKEENVLFRTSCVKKGPGGRRLCTIRFALSDFGLSVIRPDRRYSSGTEGYTSPAVIKDDDKGRDEFMTGWLVPSEIATPKETWNSYSRMRDRLRAKGGVPGQFRDIYEKNDLFGLGVLLSRFLRSPPPVVREGEGEGEGEGDSRQRARLCRLAHSLIVGPGALPPSSPVMRASDAVAACQRLMADPDVARLGLTPPSFSRTDGAWSAAPDLRVDGRLLSRA